ncbi:MAG: polyhydroxyalkanoate depolymerase [Rhizobiales bacterium]|nr:polyhydroxyalkanoate depolymerase [Hyphomicrobiales bacterium]
MLYTLYELNHAAVAPARAAADMVNLALRNPFNPLSQTLLGKSIIASTDMFERATRRYGKPHFGIEQLEIDGTRVAVTEHCAWHKPFCRLLHFQAALPQDAPERPRILLVAPMSGHYATLLRGTVETLLVDHDVYVTDWCDARTVSLVDGRFDLDDYIDYIVDMLHFLGAGTHVIAVCQPSVPVLAATAVMEANDDPFGPSSIVLMGGPIDTRCNPTAVNTLAEQRGTDWFAHNVIVRVPFPHAGFMREVYPGFLQLSGFMSMNLDRHVTAHKDLFFHFVEGDGDSIEKHETFYDEYLAVMDLTAEFYLQTVETVFVRHALPKGEMMHRGHPVDPSKIRRAALMTVEGERDDISGRGQTEAAHGLCSGIPDARKLAYVQAGVGHYGVFNGRRFRAETAPEITAFIKRHDSAGKRRTRAGSRTGSGPGSGKRKVLTPS